MGHQCGRLDTSHGVRLGYESSGLTLFTGTGKVLRKSFKPTLCRERRSTGLSSSCREGRATTARGGVVSMSDISLSIPWSFFERPRRRVPYLIALATARSRLDSAIAALAAFRAEMCLLSFSRIRDIGPAMAIP